MHHTFIGSSDLGLFWEIIRAQDGRLLSPGAASVVLHCSYTRLYELLEAGELEAWSYHKEPGGPAVHFMISIPSLVCYGVRAGRFRSAQDLGTLSVTDEEFARWQAEAARDRDGEVGG